MPAILSVGRRAGVHALTVTLDATMKGISKPRPCIFYVVVHEPKV